MPRLIPHFGRAGHIFSSVSVKFGESESSFCTPTSRLSSEGMLISFHTEKIAPLQNETTTRFKYLFWSCNYI